MILAGDFRKGVTFVYNNGIYVIVDFQHVKPGKGAAFVRTKIKNVVTGAVREETFNPSEKFELARIESKEIVVKEEMPVETEVAENTEAVVNETAEVKAEKTSENVETPVEE